MSDGLVVGGRYELRARLGRGGFGTVWQAHDTTLRREVAVKLITVEPADRDAIIERFWREAHAVASLNHPNIVTAHDFGVHDDYAYLVMELISGGSLADELASRRMGGAPPLEIARVITLGTQVSAGLAAAHAAGLVHRDLKPANLMRVRSSGTIKIVDFGIAHINALARLTKPGGYAGTLPYASPEQMAEGAVDGRSDLYSLGCLLYELLSDHSPYVAESPAQWIAAHQSALPTPLRSYLPGVPADVEALVHALLAKDPARRPPSADAVRGLLKRARLTPLATLVDSRLIATSPAPAMSHHPSPRAGNRPVAAHPMAAQPVRAPAVKPAAVRPQPAQPVRPQPARNAPQSAPAPFYAWQPVPTPQGWMVVPQLITPYPPLPPRPLTATVAARLLTLLSIASAVEAVVATAATVKIGSATQKAFTGITTSAGDTVVGTMMFVVVSYCVATVVAAILAGRNLRGSQAGRIWTWILAAPSLLFVLGGIGGRDGAALATQPKGADLLRPRVIHALAKVRAAVPPWYVQSVKLYDLLAAVVLMAVIVLLALPATSAFVRSRRSRTGRI